MKIKRAMVIATHPDDETLGCGGTILKLKAQGVSVSWLIVTNIGEGLAYTAAAVRKRQKEIQSVAKEYKFNNVIKLDFPTTRLDRIPMAQLVESMAEAVKTLKPDTVFLPFKDDIHSDHKQTFQAVLSCTKRFRYSFLNNVLMYETISETEFAAPLPKQIFIPQLFNDITHFLEKKIKIMKIYKSEMGKPPFPRSAKNIRALATFRGSTVNVKAAESFMLVKAMME